MKYGLIGERLGHSFSKILHNKIADYDYCLCEIGRDELDGFMKERDFLGINVTIPYKEAVIPYLDFVDDSAKEISAVNTVINRGGMLYGYNTDFCGMKMLFSHAGIDPKAKKVAILGTGGTSKTAFALLSSLGASEILRVSRRSGDRVITYADLMEKHSDTQIIVNTTPLGMFPDIHGCPIDISGFGGLIGVIDVVYNPINTTLVQKAREAGIAAESGLFMLVGQAVRAAELFMDKRLPDSITQRIFAEIKGEKENIVLIGMPASGKSTVGRIVAERMGRRFVDTDDLITERCGMKIKDFIPLYGEKKFRDIESEVIASVAGDTGLVIATGGGAILREKNISALKYNGKIIFIDRPLDMLVTTDSRPLSSDREALSKRYEERYPIYTSVCEWHIDGSGTADEVANKIMETYQ